MLTTHERKRRAVVAAVAALSLGDVPGKNGGSDTVRMTSSRALVAYFSRSGNTRVVAGLLQRAFKADVF
ncbi:hypothetical protein PQR37_20050 [Paraburkholderia nemoris]|uniref:hypothetical protein n=1 Tax=Paraburkholderia nemoris TaxID=2793076 RepID=UPI0038BD8F40